MSSYQRAYKDQSDTFLQVHRAFADRALDFKTGQRGLVTNGQVHSHLLAQNFLFKIIVKANTRQSKNTENLYLPCIYHHRGWV